MSFLDLDEKILELIEYEDRFTDVNHVELVASPVMDVKDVPECDVLIVEGGVANDEQERLISELRNRCKCLISLGDCAGFGTVPMLRNLFTLNDVLKRAYEDTESTEVGAVMGESKELPKLRDKFVPIRELVKVDVHVPGCPPSADTIYYVLKELLAGRIPKLEGQFLRYD